MKRSVGITVVAIVFIIWGALTLLSALNGFMMMRADSPFLDTDKSREHLLEDTAQISDEKRAELEEEVMLFDGFVKAQKEMKTSVVFRAISLYPILTGLIAILLGMGLFVVKEPARKGAIIALGISIPLFIVVNYIGMRIMMQTFTGTGFAPGKSEGLGLGEMNVITYILITIKGLFWAGLAAGLIFYLTRPKVKEQFVPGNVKVSSKPLIIIVLVLLGLGFLSYKSMVAIQSFMSGDSENSLYGHLERGRLHSKRNICLANLKQIDGAKQVWALDSNNEQDIIPIWGDLAPEYIRQKPVCRSGGTYTIGAVNEIPFCSIGDNNTEEPDDDHILSWDEPLFEID